MLLFCFSFLFLCFSLSASCAPAIVEAGSLVCGLEANGLSSWGGGMTTTSSCLDAIGCGGTFSESGGGGGGGDGVGEWSGVIGLGEVWLSGGLSG